MERCENERDASAMEGYGRQQDAKPDAQQRMANQ